MTRRSSVVRLLLAGLAVPLALLAASMPAQSSPSAARPTVKDAQYERVVMIVLDQLRPEFIEAFDMQTSSG